MGRNFVRTPMNVTYKYALRMMWIVAQIILVFWFAKHGTSFVYQGF